MILNSSSRFMSLVPQVEHHDVPFHAVISPYTSFHVFLDKRRKWLSFLRRIPCAVRLYARLCQFAHGGHHVDAVQELVGIVNLFAWYCLSDKRFRQRGIDIDDNYAVPLLVFQPKNRVAGY